MSWMNEYEIENALRVSAQYELPNLRRGAEVLSRLKDWTNSCSDGWPYWAKPGKAAAKLMDLIEPRMYRPHGEDITEAELKAALSPVKAFLTRQGVEHTTKVRIIG